MATFPLLLAGRLSVKACQPLGWLAKLKAWPLALGVSRPTSPQAWLATPLALLAGPQAELVNPQA